VDLVCGSNMLRQLGGSRIQLDPKAMFREFFGVEPNELQELAVEAIEDDKSYLVVAPTGTGKTLVGYYAILRAMASGERPLGVYMAPTRALGYEKYLEIRGSGSPPGSTTTPPQLASCRRRRSWRTGRTRCPRTSW